VVDQAPPSIRLDDYENDVLFFYDTPILWVSRSDGRIFLCMLCGDDGGLLISVVETTQQRLDDLIGNRVTVRSMYLEGGWMVHSQDGETIDSLEVRTQFNPDEMGGNTTLGPPPHG